MNASAETAAIKCLCTACALCCNGVLFADVRLQDSDNAARLAALGVPLKRRGAQIRFRQPCSCLNGNFCEIYADRPERCRTFECRLLQRVMRNEVTENSALKKISAARKDAEKVRCILRELGDADETVPLSRRYQRMMRRPIDLADDERLVDLRGELMLAVASLTESLERDFLGPQKSSA